MARIWATSYGLYNQGRLIGKWYDLEDYDDKEAFEDAVTADLSPYDDDPELMFCDHEDIPPGMVGESFVDADVWDWLLLSEDDQQLLAIYRDNVSSTGTIEAARSDFCGFFRSPAEWAEEHLEDTGALENLPDNLKGYFNYEDWARDQALSGYMTHTEVHHGKWAIFHNR